MAYRDDVLIDSPLLYWELDDNTGASTVVDSSGNSRSGTVNGSWNFRNAATHVTTSSYGTTSGGGYVISPSVAFGASDVTVEMWAYIDASQTYMLWSFGVNYLDIYVWNGRIGINTGAGDQYGCTISTGYHHIVALMPNNKATTNSKIYIDGVLQTLNGTSGTAPSISTATFQVSGWSANASYRIPSGYYVDEVAVYSGELSAARVAAHYSWATPSSAQFSTVYVETLTDMPSSVLIPAMYAETLMAGSTAALMSSIYGEVLIEAVKLQAESVFAETIVNGTPYLQLESVFGEVVADGTSQLQSESVYLEVIVSTASANFRGWGIPVSV
jgi:hypothetical protein